MSSPFVSVPTSDAFTSASTSTAPVESAPLTGYTLAVKDLFHMAGLPTAAGNPDWLASHSTPTTTNSTVTALLDAGAQFVGKTITDELAYSLNGKNKHYNTLVNPAAPEHIPGGSSSGSAVAVSTDQADVGLGTDTGGSIRVPASYQGLWGIRTTHGAIPCDNMVALAPSFDTVGWMTKEIDTLLAVAKVCLAKNSQQRAYNTPTFAIARSLFETVAHKKACDEWLAQLALTYHCIELAPDQLDIKQLATADTFRVLQGGEIWQQHGHWLNQQQPDIADDIMLRLNWCKTITTAQIDAAKAQQSNVIKHIETLFENADILVIPTTPGVAPRCDADDETLANDRNALLALTAIAGLTGLPQLHLPLFSLHNAPCGLSLVGIKGSDLALITLAQTLVK
ncbi:amidase [Alteromonas sp. 345S023]|uniref:Amidase n=1 Tax=Alteromonas profundi TaxID=2696062 RepID=A0A7X5LID6_9ALTE|nr:amidase [Alteromonas profundi]